jgi:voltage-gated potassium channel
LFAVHGCRARVRVASPEFALETALAATALPTRFHQEPISRLLLFRRFIRNETIIKEGDRGDSMYFILEGEVEIISGNQHNTLVAGDFFGEIALLKDGRRTATAKANSRCQCLELTAYDFKRYISKSPELMEAINTVAERRYAVWKETQGESLP